MFFVRMASHHYLCCTVHAYGNRRYRVGPDGCSWSGDG